MTADSSDTTHSAFRLAEKHFKNRATPDFPALKGLPSSLCAPVLDLSRPALQLGPPNDEVWDAGWWGASYAPVSPPPRFRRKGKERARGERPEQDLAGVTTLQLKDGRVGYVVAEGCILIPGYLAPPAQEALLLTALAEYTLPPNPLSLDTHYRVPPDLFAAFLSDPAALIAPRHYEFDAAQRIQLEEASKATKGPRPLIETAPAATLGYDEVKRRNATWTGDAASLKLGSKSVAALTKELRWANLGWVYQWSTKSYDFSTETPIPFPAPMKDMCRAVVASVPWGEVFKADQEEPDWQAWEKDYEPDTGIVNYYQLKDTLMAHVDRSELDPSRPLVSVSLGHACIFLLGTSSRADPPRPILLRSGDVLVMSGRGRQAYHGVPRILEGTLPAHFQESEGDSEAMKGAKRWVQAGARVNVNARQVFPPGFKIPAAEVLN